MEPVKMTDISFLFLQLLKTRITIFDIKMFAFIVSKI